MNKTFAAFVLCAAVFCSCAAAQNQSPAQKKTAAAFAKAGFKVEKTRSAPPEFYAPLANVDEKTGDSGSGPVRGTSLADYRGKVLFLNLWATWCGPCRGEMPSMEKLYRRYRDKGLEILAVNLQEEKEEVEDFMEEYSLSFPAALDGDGKIGALYGARAIPTTYILDREGKVVTRVVGSLNWEHPAIYEAFEALLAE
jgi:thiol-disulfide isomerase/thioredoxin